MLHQIRPIVKKKMEAQKRNQNFDVLGDASLPKASAPDPSLENAIRIF